MRLRRCPICRTKFEPARPTQRCCPDPDCAITLGRQIKEKADRIRHRAAVADAKPIAKLRAEAQAAFNSYIKARDARLPCIACGRHHDGQWHAGHYLSTGAHPELRFEPLNCHRECQPCNTHLSGNLIEYRKGLILRYGQDLVDWLEGPHEAKHYTREDLVGIRKKYSELCKKLLTE
jgi:hypothetical protein